MPSPLEVLQRDFVSAVVGDSCGLARFIRGGGRLSSSEAVKVYAGAYPARLTEALGETFEACWRVLGDDHFFTLCRGYIARHSSRSHNLSDYGAEFPVYLESHADLAPAPFLGDLARFEWAFKELFHAAPHRGLSPAELSAKAKPDSRMRLGPAHVLLSSSHRVFAIWKRDRGDETPLKAEDWNGHERLLLYKAGGNEIFTRELTAAEYHVLTALRSGKKLDEALESSEEMDEKGVQRFFSFLAESDLIAAIER